MRSHGWRLGVLVLDVPARPRQSAVETSFVRQSLEVERVMVWALVNADGG